MRNHIILTGRVVSNPKLKSFSDNSQLVDLSLDLGDSYIDAPSGKNIFHLIAWGRLGVELFHRIAANDNINVVGQLKKRLMNKNGIRYYRTEVLVKEFRLLDVERNQKDVEIEPNRHEY